MADPSEEQISSELVDKWSTYLDSSQRVSFQESCGKATTEEAVKETLRSFFATWKTTLMHSSLENLKAATSDDRLSALIETVVIQDDCAIIDPWVASDAPSQDISYDIWPRDNGKSGSIETNRIGIRDLAALLKEGRLRPRRIEIRDYQIAKWNLDFCPETRHARDRYKDLATADERGSAPVAEMARKIIEQGDLAVTSIAIKFVRVSNDENSFFTSPRFHHLATQHSIAGPIVYDAILTLSPEHQGQSVGFSKLHSTDLDLWPPETEHWLRRIFQQATSLENLSLQIKVPCLGTPRVAAGISPVMTRLKEFTLRHTTTSADEVLSMLAGSEESLKKLVFFGVTLEGSTWRELLSGFATFSALASFKLGLLEEKAERVLQVDFRDLRETHLPLKSRSGLNLNVQRRSRADGSILKVEYNGEDAGKVLGIVASGYTHR